MMNGTRPHPRHRKRRTAQSGFMLAPLLYMLALGGIGAAVLFSGYSQILRSNTEMTAINAVRQQLNSSAQTLSAASVLDVATSTILQPPAVEAYASVTDTARLPTNYTAVNTGSPTSYGVIDPSSGVRQLDPWGKYYIYCRWESAIATATLPSIMVISAGPDSILQTTCADATAQGDDRINKLSVAEAINRANVWQTSGSGQVKYGAAANAVKINDDGSMQAASLTLTTPLAIGSGGTGANSAALARISLGVPATDGTNATGTWPISISGTSTALATARNFSIAGTTGLTAANVAFDGTANVALTLTGTLALANGGTGATDAATARTNLAVLGIANNLSEISTAGAAAQLAARGNLGADNASNLTSGTVAAARLGSGTANNTVYLRGDSTWAGVSASALAGYPGDNTKYLSGDGTWTVPSGGGGSLSGGTANYVPLWSSATALTSSMIYQSSGRIGIGTTSPAEPLDISVSAGSDASLVKLRNASSSGYTELDFYDSSNAWQAFIGWGNASVTNGGASTFFLGTEGAYPIVFWTNGNERMRITSTGAIGIGTSSPAASLDVSGAIYSRSYNAGSSTTIDFSQGNVTYTSAACGAFTLSNIQDGGSYTLISTGSGTGPATFTHTGLTVKTTGTLTCTTAKHTVFTFLRAGSNLYVSMVAGF